MKFELQHTDPYSSARTGLITTDHGQIKTPIFMPVGTVGSVKAVHFEELRRQVMAQIILGNTYHLYLRPGLDILRKAGGLHKFNGWEKPILTDSGGFQVFSLTGIRKLKEEGCEFRSHIDGSKHFFTPENVMDTERIIGADIIMAFDECAPGEAEYSYAKASCERTTRWLMRCKAKMQELNSSGKAVNPEQMLFGINQGCTFGDLRVEHMKRIAELDTDGYAIGGLAVGEPTEVMYDIIEQVTEYMPREKIRYLMGVGTPLNILNAVERGVDLFDCVMPSRNARHGHLFTSEGIINLNNQKYERDMSPVDEKCGCPVCRQCSRAYLRHLLKAGEMLSGRLNVIHNLWFYNHLMTDIRAALNEGRFAEFKAEREQVLGRRI